MFTYLKGQIHVIILGFITALIFHLSVLQPYILVLIDIVFNDNRSANSSPFSMRSSNYRYVFDRSYFRFCINQII